MSSAALDPLQTSGNRKMLALMGAFMTYIVRTTKIAVVLYAGISICLGYLVARDGAAVLKDAAVTATLVIIPIASAIIAIGSDKSEQK